MHLSFLLALCIYGGGGGGGGQVLHFFKTQIIGVSTYASIKKKYQDYLQTSPQVSTNLQVPTCPQKFYTAPNMKGGNINMT